MPEPGVSMRRPVGRAEGDTDRVISEVVSLTPVRTVESLTPARTVEKYCTCREDDEAIE
jgi:hypothetical protein